MKFQLISITLTMALLMPAAYARDYSYMDDHPTRTSSSTSGTGSSSGLPVLDAVVSTAVKATMDSVFSEDEKNVIRRYYRGYGQDYRDYDDDRESRYAYDDDDDYDKKGKKHKKHKKHKNKKKSLPPGLRKKLARGGELPPGWQKKVARGEVMESSVYRESKPLPRDLRKKLPELILEPGAEVREVNGKVVKILKASGLIVDAFDL